MHPFFQAVFGSLVRMPPGAPFAARLLWCSLALALAACSTPSSPPLPTVASVDLSTYMGSWYEIARLPNRFQNQCVADTQAHYALQGGGSDARVRVTNRCRTADGRVDEVQGLAYPVEGSANAKLRVSFFRPFYGDYWVLAFGPGQQWVLVGEPSRRYSWVLSRSPQMNAPELAQALAQARALGFDAQAYLRTPQTRPLAP